MATVSRTIRLVLVDDHPTLLAGIRVLFEAERDMEVIGQADDGASAVELALELQPDVVIMDVALPTSSGVDATKAIRERNENIRVLAFSAHEDLVLARKLLDAGASGYVFKRGACEQLIHAARVVAGGGIYLAPSLADRLLRGAAGQVPAACEAPRLSARELEVIQLIANGQTMKEIAASLRLSVRTLDTYRSRAMEKLSLNSRAELIRYAAENNWFRAVSAGEAEGGAPPSQGRAWRSA